MTRHVTESNLLVEIEQSRIQTKKLWNSMEQTRKSHTSLDSDPPDYSNGVEKLELEIKNLKIRMEKDRQKSKPSWSISSCSHQSSSRKFSSKSKRSPATPTILKHPVYSVPKLPVNAVPKHPVNPVLKLPVETVPKIPVDPVLKHPVDPGLKLPVDAVPKIPVDPVPKHPVDPVPKLPVHPVPKLHVDQIPCLYQDPVPKHPISVISDPSLNQNLELPPRAQIQTQFQYWTNPSITTQHSSLLRLQSSQISNTLALSSRAS